MKELLKSEYRPDYFLDVLFLVICRYNYYTITAVHRRILLLTLQTYTKKLIECLCYIIK